MSPRQEASAESSGPSAELVVWLDGVCQVRRESTWNPPPPVVANAVTEADRPVVAAYLAAARDHRLGLIEASTWSFGSPSLADLAKENPSVAEAQEQARSC